MSVSIYPLSKSLVEAYITFRGSSQLKAVGSLALRSLVVSYYCRLR